MKDRTGDKQRLQHIAEAVNEIETYLKGISYNSFSENSMMRFATIKQLEIIGEAANYISPETKLNFPAVQWKQITGLRHILVHEYFGIDTILVWQIIQDDIPKLKAEIQSILSEI